MSAFWAGSLVAQLLAFGIGWALTQPVDIRLGRGKRLVASAIGVQMAIVFGTGGAAAVFGLATALIFLGVVWGGPVAYHACRAFERLVETTPDYTLPPDLAPIREALGRKDFAAAGKLARQAWRKHGPHLDLLLLLARIEATLEDNAAALKVLVAAMDVTCDRPELEQVLELYYQLPPELAFGPAQIEPVLTLKHPLPVVDLARPATQQGKLAALAPGEHRLVSMLHTQHPEHEWFVAQGTTLGHQARVWRLIQQAQARAQQAAARRAAAKPNQDDLRKWV
jgi:hypothetical protein